MTPPARRGPLYAPLSRVRTLALLPILLGGCSEHVETRSGQYKLEAWADHWFSLSLGDTLVVEDPVSIKEDDSGLEYIGTDRQQMGDGGFIAQITDSASSTSGRRAPSREAPAR